MSLNSFWNRTVYLIKKDHIPVTYSLLIYSIVVFCITSFIFEAIMIKYMAFDSSSALRKPWSLFLYPFSPGYNGIIGFIFTMFWLWIAGGSLERSWGTVKFSIYMLLNAFFSALGLLLGGLISNNAVYAAGMWLPLAGITIAFSLLNPEEKVNLWCILPLKMKYLAILTVVVTMMNYASYGFIIAVFSLMGCAFSMWYISGRRFAFHYGQHTPRKTGEVIRVYPRETIGSKINPLKIIEEHRERKRVRDLFKRSGIDDK